MPKQISFVVECVLTETPTIIVREARSGAVVKVCKSFDEVASFLPSYISTLEAKTTAHES